MLPFALMTLTLLTLGSLSSDGQDVPIVVINEIGWAGTSASGTDEWIELYNNTDDPIDLIGWTLRWDDKLIHFGVEADDTVELRESEIRARNYYLLERTDDDVIVNVEADLIYKGSLKNTGEVLELFDAQGILSLDATTSRGSLIKCTILAFGKMLKISRMYRILAGVFSPRRSAPSTLAYSSSTYFKNFS